MNKKDNIKPNEDKVLVVKCVEKNLSMYIPKVNLLLRLHKNIPPSILPLPQDAFR